MSSDFHLFVARGKGGGGTSLTKEWLDADTIEGAQSRSKETAPERGHLGPSFHRMPWADGHPVAHRQVVWPAIVPAQFTIYGFLGIIPLAPFSTAHSYPKRETPSGDPHQAGFFVVVYFKNARPVPEVFVDLVCT